MYFQRYIPEGEVKERDFIIRNDQSRPQTTYIKKILLIIEFLILFYFVLVLLAHHGYRESKFTQAFPPPLMCAPEDLSMLPLEGILFRNTAQLFFS
jgi:hypothetical protein